MRLINNFKREERILKAFIKNYDFTIGDYIKTESPDFLGKYKNKILGIEITEVYSQKENNGEPPRVHEIRKQTVVDGALKLALKNKLPPLHVHIIMSDTIPKRRCAFLTDYLFNTVKENIPNYGEKLRLADTLIMPEEFHCISISNYEYFTKPCWYCSETAFGYADFFEDIKIRLGEKERKLDKYLKKCDECWLIIVALGISGSTFYEFVPEMNSYIFQTSYPKVFFADSFNLTFNHLTTSTD